MFHKNITNGGDYQHHHMVIGDVLLHSEIKSPPIQVIIHSLPATSSLKLDKPHIPRILSNSSEITNNPTIISCDLKNPVNVKQTHERTFSSKKIMRLHKAGWALVKELKSKVLIIHHTEPKMYTVNIDSNAEQTQL